MYVCYHVSVCTYVFIVYISEFVCVCVRVCARFASRISQTLFVPDPTSVCREVYVAGAATDQYGALSNP